MWGSIRLCAAFFGTIALLLPAPNRFRVYSNPAIVILAITEGPDGFLWLAAEDGVYRFDGFHYQRIAGYPFRSARFIGLASDGNLWIGGREGLVRYRGKFEVILRDEVNALAVLNDIVFVGSPSRPVMRVTAGGSASAVFMARNSLNVDFAGHVSWVHMYPGRFVLAEVDTDGKQVAETELPGTAQQALRDAGGRVWIADEDRAAALVNGREVLHFTRKFSQKTHRQPPLLPGRNGQLWFIGESAYGLVREIAFHDRALNNQYQPTAAYEDARGHLWVAKLGQGLVEWIPDPAWQRWFSEDFDRQPVAQVARTAQGSFLAATHGNIDRLDSSGKWVPISKQSRRYSSLLPLDDGSILASIRGFGLARLSPAGAVLEHPGDPLGSPDQYREVIADGRGGFWAGNKLGLIRITGHPGALELHKEDLPGNGVQAVDVQADRTGRVWAGYESGIAWRDEQDRWHRLETDPPIFGIRSFAVGKSGEEIWAAYRHGGKYSRLRKVGERWKVDDLEASKGYGPPDTHFIRVDSRGWVWRGSTDGVHVSDGRRAGRNDWIHLGMQNGLATDAVDQYGFFEDRDGTVWISGEAGVTHLRPDFSWFDAPRKAAPPRITRLEIDGREQPRLGAADYVLPVSGGTVRIELGSLETPDFRDDPLRYRFLPGEDWKVAHDGALIFRDLKVGRYRLEIGYAGSGPSVTSQYSFQVTGSPVPGWKWILGTAIGIVVVGLVLQLPVLDRCRYRLAKALFLMWRRLAPSGSDGNGRMPRISGDTTGRTMAGRYLLMRLVSRGGFSAVYEGRDLECGNRSVAVKILDLPPGKESWVRDRFAHEIAALRSLSHPAVVEVLDSCINPDGAPCLVMPFLKGPTLRMRLEEGPLPPARAAHLVRQIGAALAEIHRRGIVHRDLKPENVILVAGEDGTEQPVVLDFGTSGIRGAEDRLANTTLLAGSFHYMAPERLTGHYSPASDVYSMAVMILEAIAGKRLGDLGILTSDEGFTGRLKNLLGGILGSDVAPGLALELTAAFNSVPGARPADVRDWAERVAAMLDQARSPMRPAIQRMPKS